MNQFLTKQEQRVICVVIGLVLTGLVVKAYRLSHPAPMRAQPTELSK